MLLPAARFASLTRVVMRFPASCSASPAARANAVSSRGMSGPIGW